MALRLARATGSKVVIISSSDVRLSRVRHSENSGTIPTINYRTNPGWGQEVLRLNAGVGVDVELENDATPTLVQRNQRHGQERSCQPDQIPWQTGSQTVRWVNACVDQQGYFSLVSPKFPDDCYLFVSADLARGTASDLVTTLSR